MELDRCFTSSMLLAFAHSSMPEGVASRPASSNSLFDTGGISAGRVHGRVEIQTLYAVEHYGVAALDMVHDVADAAYRGMPSDRAMIAACEDTPPCSSRYRALFRSSCAPSCRRSVRMRRSPGWSAPAMACPSHRTSVWSGSYCQAIAAVFPDVPARSRKYSLSIFLNLFRTG